MVASTRGRVWPPHFWCRSVMFDNLIDHRSDVAESQWDVATRILDVARGLIFSAR